MLLVMIGGVAILFPIVVIGGNILNRRRVVKEFEADNLVRFRCPSPSCGLWHYEPRSVGRNDVR